MTAEEAIRRIEHHMEVHHIGEYPHFYIGEALALAIDALREYDSRTKQPLTIQELRKMDGQTVYCLDLNMEVTVFAPEKGLINVSNGAFILQARNATLYRDRPKEKNEIAPQAFPPVTTPVCGLVHNDKSERPGALLHNKDCPYDYKCRAMDCIECAEIYAEESEES